MDRVGEPCWRAGGEGRLTVDQTREYRSERREIAGVPFEVTSYKIGDRYYCHVTNADPGATVARAEGASREEAEELALAKVVHRLGGRGT